MGSSENHRACLYVTRRAEHGGTMDTLDEAMAAIVSLGRKATWL